MPRKRKAVKEEAKEDSKNDVDNKPSNGGKRDAAATDEANEGETPEPVAAPGATTTRPKKRKRKTFDETVDDYLPSHERKTAKGGYAHTNKSKSRISKANTGNTPWNKGRNRSSADKAKIAAGVRARNRAILLDKLKRLGMTEEEWFQKKKEIKYLRERIRRAKAANAQHQAALAEQKLKAALQATSDKPAGAGEGVGQKDEDGVPGSTNGDDDPDKKGDDADKREGAVNVFSRDITWTPYSFGPEGQSFDQVCPQGGPGGLICCGPCSKAYSAYLVQTAKDIEIQKTHKCGKEVKEILEFLEEGCEKLDRAVRVARKLVPPLPPKLPEPEQAKKPTRRSTGSKMEVDLGDWNVTSAIDIGATEGVAV